MRTMEQATHEWELEKKISHHQLECQKMLRKLDEARGLIETMTRALRRAKVDREIANDVYHLIKRAEELLPTLNVALSFKPEYPVK